LIFAIRLFIEASKLALSRSVRRTPLVVQTPERYALRDISSVCMSRIVFSRTVTTAVGTRTRVSWPRDRVNVSICFWAMAIAPGLRAETVKLNDKANTERLVTVLSLADPNATGKDAVLVVRMNSREPTVKLCDSVLIGLLTRLAVKEKI